MIRNLNILVFIILLSSFGCAAMKAASVKVQRISTEDLNARLDDTDVTIIDVRAQRHWDESNYKIKGAIREDPRDSGSWASKYDRAKTIVLYCA